MPLDWDAFRFVKTVATQGGLTAAAAQLGINHSTAFRRLTALETKLGARLFERLRTGYVPTPCGQAMVEAANRIEADVTRFERRAVGRSETPSGELRVTAPTSLALELLMPILADFATRYPEIRIELILAEAALNLSRRDADVAIRASRDPSETLVGRRLAAVAWAIYGRADREYRDLASEAWVSPDPTVAGGTFARFAGAQAPADRVRLRINTVTGLEAAVAAGIGIGPLPCFSADANPALRRLSGPHPELGVDLWVLTHPDLRHAARVRVFMDHIAEAILPLRPRFEGLPVAGLQEQR
ncbi:LysR family transcriptional regulator [Methylobacterium sp. J-088]|uniref:LysR family transcriptional regulator n=1 Tax=Methylobacterium sp. J-088 TaxID=2836664 RepID=UPI001FBA632D|nr:LysR family transcriptional regulator [Methylobacterium sp. J-088]MCJ2063762.1 LysR family transcriptional regulator [Methylobacterium sp. J-088]